MVTIGVRGILINTPKTKRKLGSISETSRPKKCLNAVNRKVEYFSKRISEIIGD